jgi:hypothetical protein
MRSGIYQHYKGGLYQVLGIGQHTETNEIVVIYIPLQLEAGHSGPRLRVRPLHGLNGFNSSVKVESRDVTRFIYLGSGE